MKANDMLKLVLGVLITWRLTSLAVVENGPKDILAKAREAAGVRFDEFSRCQSDTWIGSALCCVKCSSVWVGWLVGLVLERNLWRAFWFGLAYSAGALQIERWRR